MAALYVFRCDAGHRFETPFHDTTMCPEHFNTAVARDYRAEGVAPAIANLRRENSGKDTAWFKENFLPTAADYRGPDDPDGSKGLKQWNDEHIPRADNKNPARPDTPKRVF